MLKNFCIIHKRFEKKPCETVKIVYLPKNIN